RRRRGVGRDQRAALPVAEGDHGREEEAAGDPLRVRPRRRRVATRRGRLEDGGALDRGPAGARRHGEDRGRRQRRAEDRGLPRGEAPAVKSVRDFTWTKSAKSSAASPTGSRTWSIHDVRRTRTS